MFIEFFMAKELRATYAGETLYGILIRTIGLSVFAALIGFVGYSNIFKGKINRNKARTYTFVAVAFVIAVNNFPFVSLALGEVSVNLTVGYTLLYALLCISVAAFEELAFRGFVFMLALEKLPKNRKGAFVAIVISSAIFGAIHFVNVFAGAGVGSVVLQMGYSSLIGALATVMLLKTHNIFYSIALHAIYNFNGGLVPEFGEGQIWTTGEVIFTAVVSVLVAVYVIWEFFGMSDGEVKELFEKGSGETDDNS